LTCDEDRPSLSFLLGPSPSSQEIDLMTTAFAFRDKSSYICTFARTSETRFTNKILRLGTNVSARGVFGGSLVQGKFAPGVAYRLADMRHSLRGPNLGLSKRSLRGSPVTRRYYQSSLARGSNATLRRSVTPVVGRSHGSRRSSSSRFLGPVNGTRLAPRIPAVPKLSFLMTCRFGLSRYGWSAHQLSEGSLARDSCLPPSTNHYSGIRLPCRVIAPSIRR